uniref:Uncharacterized protein n=1 Tax=Fagus sylvatica TaxID=28930 RepID=A0A2N9G7Z9_FAGSY
MSQFIREFRDEGSLLQRFNQEQQMIFLFITTGSTVEKRKGNILMHMLSDQSSVRPGLFLLQASIRSLIKLVALLGIYLASSWIFSASPSLISAISRLHQATCRAQEFFAEKLTEFTYQVCQTTIKYLGYFHHNRFRQNKEKENQSSTEYLLVSFVHSIGSTRAEGKETHQSTCSAPRLHQASPRLRCEPSRTLHLVPWDLFGIGLVLVGLVIALLGAPSLSSAISWLHQATCRAQEFFAKNSPEHV